MAFIEAEPSIHCIANEMVSHVSYGSALECLGNAPPSKEIKEALIRVIDKPPGDSYGVRSVLEDAFKALNKYYAEVPSDRLAAWLLKPCEKDHGPDAVKVLYAARILFSMPNAALSEEQFNKLPEGNRMCILRAGQDKAISNGVRNQLIRAALKQSSMNIDGVVRDVIATKDYIPDEQTGVMVAAHIGQLPSGSYNDKARKENLERAWYYLLSRNAKELKGKWVVEQFRNYLKDGKEVMANEVVRALLELDDGIYLGSALPGLVESSREFIVSIQSWACLQNKRFTKPAQILFEAGLKDEAAKVRLKSFEGLANMYRYGYGKNESVMSLLKTTAARERDPATKKNMDSHLASLGR
jgi:hypothetical protein